MEVRIDGGPDCTHYRRLVFPITNPRKECDFCGRTWPLPPLNFDGVFQPTDNMTPSWDGHHSWNGSIERELEAYQDRQAGFEV